MPLVAYVATAALQMTPLPGPIGRGQLEGVS
jgi:hypothetical protein